MDFFEEAVAIERAHAEQYLGMNCPVCGKPAFLCTCPSFVEKMLRDDEIAELKAESDALWDAFNDARSEP